MAKYPIKQSLKNISEIIAKVTVGPVDMPVVFACMPLL
uniref:Uncharacterized protein n=1 Tax=Anguilla anguilla TaxID=7936 RepID=A0A0E9TB51_ANGAN